MTRNSLFFGAEPFEELQGDEAEKVASADELKAFYQNMEKKEKQQQLERKASRRRSLFRKTSGKNPESAATSKTETEHPSPPTNTTGTALKQTEQRQDAEMEKLEQEKNDNISSLPASRSIIPDTLKELPSWYTKDDWASTTSFRVRFPIHNPVGPRYYRNHHLVPPSVYRPGARPPSVFSPSFPAMGTSSLPERIEDISRGPGPSRTPSHSPLPTPSSSQTRVAELGIKPRSRTTSQSAHDNVDLLDVTDPWGTAWHHESPYDIGLGSSGPIAADTDLARSRRSSLTTQARRKTVTPSPLSQSTSAIHLQVPSAQGSHLPRKLSKRRGLAGIFGSYGKSHQKDSHSLPTSPVAADIRSPPPPLDDRSNRSSLLPPGPPSSTNPFSAIKKERRGSIMGRLTKRFSVTRKPATTTSPVTHDGLPHTEDHSTEIRSMLSKSSEKLSKRVPPPSVDEIRVDEVPVPLKTADDVDRRSSMSVDAEFPAVGKLTVANPDAPSSEISTPPQVSAPLPVDSPDPQPLPKQQTQPSSSNLPHDFSSPLATTSYPPSSSAQAQTTANPTTSSSATTRKSFEPPSFASHPSNAHVHHTPSDSVPKPSSRHRSGRRMSVEEKPLPKPVERVESPLPSNARRSMEHKRPERGPPPPSATTKPIPLPEVSVAPPPPSVTTKPIPLPSAAAPHPPSATTKPIPLPDANRRAENPTSKPSPSHLTANPIIPEDSPLSTASMVVNPPTPNVVDQAPIPVESMPVPASTSKPSSQREPSPGISSVTARETETFKLVRTQSGNIKSINETIPAAGEQWEVEEVAQTKRSSKSRDKDRYSPSKSDRDHHAESRDRGRERERERERERDRESRRDKDRDRDRDRESRRQEKRAIGVETGNVHSGNGDQRTSKSHRQFASVDDIPPAKTYSEKAIGRSSSLESHTRAPIPEYMRPDEGRSGRTRDGGKRSSRKPHEYHSASPTKPSSSSSRPIESSSSRPIERERRSSKSARPTSEVSPAADLNALRAREAWDMERLYKGRSMYGAEQNGETVVPPAAVPVTSSSTSLPNGSSSTSKHNGAIHGSSHTSFVLQNFGSQGTTQIYHSMPTQPPPIIYASTSLPATQTASAPVPVSPPRASSFPAAVPAAPSSSPQAAAKSSSTPNILSFPRAPNPLPDPPRETSTPPRLSQTFSETKPANKYWTTYAEVTLNQ